MRKDYRGVHDLDESWLVDGWESLLRRWMHDAVAASVVEPNAMVLGTVDERGWPATRTVLCKGVTEEGITFYTNYDSDKARQLAATPHASATFTWPLIGRQVTLRGVVRKVSVEQTAEYWGTRPRGSQLGAWASQQSRPAGGRDDLERALAQVSARFGDGPVPVPPNWGGYLLRPGSVEFWQGRANRMHNRIRTTMDATGRWSAVRLQP
ncbi:pyridoxamine 5'-phosphate oxidase [Aldersonia sp. NBC_00410]|uniref:pyridoxamine 5'-phosphate oxidase n=1 Tax=Aldersonia sp. NBC_00410 TaxID=2975954 RepID=UPI002252F5E6|nr:pyridoxamine 5'-phosphate oxidase [Aldersonia sp. NBC_00410]MCX5045678.1 pyridoxamine 5'-phosphate oxidase [Aldersonia sp. NBC_00410]